MLYPHKAHIWITAGLISGLGAGVPAHADNWKYGGSLDVEAGYSDNAFLNSEETGRDADLSLTVTPRGTIRGEGARVSANVDASVSRTHSVWATRGGRTFLDVLGNGHAEWLEDFAFLDAQLSIGDHTVKPDQPSSASTSGQQRNRSTVTAMNLAQSFRHRFSNLASTELLLRYSTTLVETEEISDTHTLLGRFSVNSGRYFQRFRWGVEVSQSESKREEPLPILNQRTVNSNYTLALTRSVSAVGSVGYEEFNDNTLSDAPEGLIWSGGLEIRPGRRTFLRGTYGERYDDETFDFEGRYEISPRTSFRASFGQSIETSQTEITNDLRFLGIDPDGNFIDTRTGLPFEFEGAAFGLQNATFRVKRFNASARFGGRRSNLTLRGNWRSQESDRENLAGDANADQVTYGGGLAYTRSLNRRTDGAASAGYSRTEFENATLREDDRYTAALTVTYDVARKVKLTGGYGYVMQRSNDAEFNYYEHSGFIRFRREF